MNESTPPSLPFSPFSEIAGARSCLYGYVVTMAVSTVIFALFIISQYRYVKSPGREVWILYPLSYLYMLSACIIGILFLIYGGAGGPTPSRFLTVTALNYETLLRRLEVGTEFLYLGCVTLPKVCLLVLYLRIFKVGSAPRVRLATWVLLATVVAYGLSTSFIVWPAICQPFAFKWDKTIEGGHCGDIITTYQYISLPNILTDLAILVIPIAPLCRLQMDRLRKVGLMVTVLAGSLGIIFSILRFAVLVTAPADKSVYIWILKTNIYSVLEINSYFICSCLPGIRPLVRLAHDKLGRGNSGGILHSDPATTSGCQAASGPKQSVARCGGKITGFESDMLHTDSGLFIRPEDTFEIDIESNSSGASGEGVTKLQLAHFSNFGRGLNMPGAAAENPE